MSQKVSISKPQNISNIICSNRQKKFKMEENQSEFQICIIETPQRQQSFIGSANTLKNDNMKTCRETENLHSSINDIISLESAQQSLKIKNNLKRQTKKHIINLYKGKDYQKGQKSQFFKKMTLEDQRQVFDRSEKILSQQKHPSQNRLNFSHSLDNKTKKCHNLIQVIIKKQIKKKTKKSEQFVPLTQKQIEFDAKILIKGQAIKTKLFFCKNTLTFIQKSFVIQAIDKIKLVPFSVQNSKSIWIKITVNQISDCFQVSDSSEKEFNNLQIKIMSKIIAKKISIQDHQNKLILEAPTYSNHKITANSWIYGKIYKKSQFMGKWQHKFVILKEDGIYIINNPYNIDQNYDFIASKTIKYIWTRFQVIYDAYLVLKLKNGIKKIQFAIPITKFYPNSDNNWLVNFCKFII